jgi:hypothetical protein
MKLVGIDIAPSPEREGQVRLTGMVRYDDARGGPSEEAYWLEVPAAYEPSLSASGNPWLVMLLPVAVVSGEPLVLSRPVDATLLDHAHELMAIWHGWHPHLPAVPIEADVLDGDAPGPAAGAGGARNPRTASFFSGGVDSFCVALRDRAAPIDDLLLVLGTFDLADATPEALERVRATMQRAADALGKTLVPVTTNQIRTRMRDSHPQSLSGTSMRPVT